MVAAAPSWVLSSSGVDIATIDSGGWSARDGNTGNGHSGCGGVVINCRLDAGINNTLESSTGALSMLISARLKRHWRVQQRPSWDALACWDISALVWAATRVIDSSVLVLSAFNSARPQASLYNSTSYSITITKTPSLQYTRWGGIENSDQTEEGSDQTMIISIFHYVPVFGFFFQVIAWFKTIYTLD